MLTNQYLKEEMYCKKLSEHFVIGNRIKEKCTENVLWLKNLEKDRNLFAKYGNIKYEKAKFRLKRNKAYARRFHTGENLFVGYNVYISRQHFLKGKLIIGNNVFFNRNNWIDYSGGLTIKDSVSLSNGVIIETHSHPAFSDPTKSFGEATPSPLIIEEGVIIGSNAIITESCNKIGRCSRIGAGSVCTKNIPPYSIVMGAPAKVVGFVLNPEEIIEYEKDYYVQENRYSLLELQKNFNKYFVKRVDEIKELLK